MVKVLLLIYLQTRLYNCVSNGLTSDKDNAVLV